MSRRHPVFAMLDRLTAANQDAIDRGEPVIVRMTGGPNICLKCRRMVGEADYCPACDGGKG